MSAKQFTDLMSKLVPASRSTNRAAPEPNVWSDATPVTNPAPRWVTAKLSSHTIDCFIITELSTGRMDPRVGSGHDFAGFWARRVGSGQHFEFVSFLLIISW